MERTQLVVFVAAGGTEPALASEGDVFEISAVRAAVHCAAVGRIAAMDHLVDVFNNSGPGMRFVKDMFIIVSKNRL